jgi:hypothetical protein
MISLIMFGPLGAVVSVVLLPKKRERERERERENATVA